MTIQDEIKKKLAEIEMRENVKVLYAAESGSRAWGFASPDSDYDVRFIYVRPAADYLRLEKTRDVIEWQLDAVYDINGWDLRKTLQLLHKSNPTLFEWGNSPLVYRSSEIWEKLHGAFDRYFLDRAGMWHYLSMAQTNYREYLRGDTVPLKKYLYVLRPLFACRWILAHHCPPPMRFEELTNAAADPAIVPAVRALTAQKMQSPELGCGAKIPALNAYIERSIPELLAAVHALPADSRRDWAELNAMFAAALGAE